MPSYSSYKRQMSVLDGSDDITWITVNGNHIPIKKGQSKGDAVKSFFENKGKSEGQQNANGEKKVDKKGGRATIYKNAMHKVRTFKAKDEGTYDYNTGKPKSYAEGFSVSFHQNEPNEDGKWKSDYGRYTEEEYDKLVNDMAKETDDGANIGYFEGTPEVSFYVKSIDKAIKLMKKYNQQSIWDWKNCDIIPNDEYDPKLNPMKTEDRER